MKKRVLITGAGGLLGRELSRAWEKIYSLTTLDRQNLDICDFEAVLELFNKIRPDVVVNAAAYTNVELAEKNPERCFEVNVEGTYNVGRACSLVNARMCHIGTDYIFDGKSHSPYIEEDKASPLNVYGKSKWDSERVLEKISAKYLIARVSWLCGIYGSNFIKTLLKKASQEKSIKVVNDQIGVPTFTKDVSVALQALIDAEEEGVYHVTSGGSCSWYELAQELVKQERMDTEILPCSSGDFKSDVSRPPYSVLDSSKLKKVLGRNIMPSWQEGLHDMLFSLKNQTEPAQK
ncbi:dTDP-4-dehydrorhamnose reductase [PVC group bacterium (ex Bugula neritina AB1)]|nr:dTDP-4-dehydrorhamnose reductase [PVC group bacterium (ex Bugula neritina AB1)]